MKPNLMILAAGDLRVALVTGHIAVSEIANQLTEELIVKRIKQLHKSLVEDFGIRRPKIAVLGLNPHASDGGLMGDERALKNMFKHKSPENPQKKANYIHFEDILRIVELLINSDTTSEIYNIVAPEHPSIAEILQLNTPENTNLPTENKHRIMSSAHFIQNFNYTFIHPNPKYF